MSEAEAENGQNAAHSLKCGDCGIALRNTEAAEWHAVKTQHTNFEESTETIAPLTEEQKKEKLEQLRQKAALRKQQQAKEDVKQHKANEEIRRKADVDSAKLIEEQRRLAQLKDIEKQKRQKAEDLRAKQKVRQEIEADKAARKAQAERDQSSRRDGPRSELTSQDKAEPATAATKPKTAATETRLQIRVSGRQPIVQTFKVGDSLRDVAMAINDRSGVSPDTATFTMNFPKKTIKGSEMDGTLKDLGLVPSASLVLQ